MVQVQEMHGHESVPALGLGHGLAQTIQEENSVRQVGEGVVVSQMLDLGLGLFAVMSRNVTTRR